MTREKSFLDAIREKFGTEVFTSTSDITDIISTGSISLDVSTGVGGFPLGRFISIFGPDSSGKTTLALSLSKQALLQGKKVLFIDIEQTLDNSLIQSILGDLVSNNNFVVAKPKTAEQSFSIAEEAINSKEFSIIIFDSVGALAPEKEMDDDFGDSNVALVARLSTTFLRRNAYNVRINNILFIFLNQVRANIGSYIKTWETPGGYAIKHYSSLTIMLTHAEDILSKKGDKGTSFGNWTKFVIKKNKIGPPHREARFPIIWGVGIDYMRDVLEFASMLGVITSKGPYKTFEGETLGLGDVKTLARLTGDKELLDKIVETCNNIVGIKSKITDEEDEEE